MENKPKYYEVKFDNEGRAEILGLPKGEKISNYIIEIASLEILKETGWQHVAVKADPQTITERDDWRDEGGKVK